MSVATLFKPIKLKLSKQRQLTIPENILEFLGVKPGQSIVVSKAGNGKMVIQKT